MGHVEESDLIRSYLLSFQSGDPDGIAAHVSEQFQNEHLGLLGKGCVGRETYRERLKGFLAGFENLSYEPLAIVANEGQGSARYTMRFSQSGREFAVNGMMWFEIANGQITKRIDCWDSLKYFQQAETDISEIEPLLNQQK